MGAVATPVAILGGLISTVGTIEGANAREDALQERERQNELATTQQKIKEEDKLERVLSSQKAVEAATPFKTTSASFGVISQESIDEFAEDREATNLNLKFQNEAIDQQIGNIQNAEFLGVANNLFDAGTMYYRMKERTKGLGDEGLPTDQRSPYDPTRYMGDQY